MLPALPLSPMFEPINGIGDEVRVTRQWAAFHKSRNAFEAYLAMLNEHIERAAAKVKS